CSLQLLKQVRFVVTELRLQPIFGEEKYFSICLPYPIAFHPLPMAAIENRGRHFFFHVEQASLHESLHRRNGKAYSGSLNHRFHARIYQKIFKELFNAVKL